MSRSAIAMETQLAGALTDPSVASLSKSLISQDAGLTPFQKDMLGVNVLLARPSVRAALAAAKHGHHLTRVQIHVLVGVFASFAHNPAIDLLIAEGRRLKGQPATLAADVAAGSNPAARLSSGSPETPDALYNAAWSRFARAWDAAHAQQLSGATRALLTAPGATSYLQTLPPLAVASLIPEEQFLALHLPSESAKATRLDRPATAHAAAEEGYAVGLAMLEAKLGLDQVVGNLQDEVVLKAILKGATVVFSGTVAAASEPWLVAIADFLGAISVGEAIVGAIPKLAYLNEVTSLEIVPGNPTVSAGQPVGFKIIADDKAGHPIDYVPAPSVHLTFVDNPDAPVDPYETCNDATQTCSAGRKGTHSIEAEFDFVHAFASIMITPGAETGLELSPDPNTTDTGVLSPEFTATGLDSYGNNLGAVTDFTLTASSGASCTGHTCTAGSAGNYAVTATDGKGLGAATLTVTGGLMITPTSLPDGAEGMPYSETLQATGGTEPYTWALTSGSLPEGLELDEDTGEISGTPTKSGESTFEVTVTDLLGATAKATYNKLTVKGRNETILVDGVDGGVLHLEATLDEPFDEGLDAEGGLGPYTWTVGQPAPTCPGLLLLSEGRPSDEDVIEGVLAEVGTCSATLEVHDAYGDSGTIEIVVEVRPDA
jgi:hypothetical protein